MNPSSKKRKYQLVDLHILYNNYFISFNNFHSSLCDFANTVNVKLTLTITFYKS